MASVGSGWKSSQENPVNAGVPQGSILGPTLLLLYINDLLDYVICKIAIYADYTTYLLVVSSPCSTHSGLECNLLCHWSAGISSFRSATSQTDIQVFLG